MILDGEAVPTNTPKYTFAWDLGIVPFIITLVVIFLVFGLLVFAFFKVCRRKSAFIILGVSGVLFLAAYLLNLTYVAMFVAASFAAAIAICLFANLGDLRAFLANPFRKTSAKAANFGVEKIYNREQLYKKIETAVLALSKSKTGAIMTFERNTSLKDIIKNGVPVNAPVSPEL
ncbi:MAG: DNA integrity scanning protein DisA nucleotide-binding domain protein, partial [Bacilli bacterium]|nr:DNA integrity scanning protein DisA nucleotide-binding domain protein [Bacilli bacterium]